MINNLLCLNKLASKHFTVGNKTRKLREIHFPLGFSVKKVAGSKYLHQVERVKGAHQYLAKNAILGGNFQIFPI